MMESGPFLSTGEVVRNYAPLMKYLEICGKEILPSQKDLEFIKHRAEMSPSVDDLFSEISKRKEPQIDKECAVRAVKEAWSISLSKELAVEEILKEVAGWEIEIAHRLGLIKLKGLKELQS